MTPADRRRLADAVIARMGGGILHRLGGGLDRLDLPDGVCVYLDADGGLGLRGRLFRRRRTGRGWVDRTVDDIVAAIRGP